MRFVCDSCRAQYMISDDKVGAKGVKVRCKKCGHDIVVRHVGATPAKEDARAGEAAGGAAASAESSNGEGFGLPSSLGMPPEGGLFGGVEEDEIGAVFDQVLNTGSTKVPEVDKAAALEAADRGEAVRKLAEAEASSTKPAAAHEWFVAIDEKQVGPLSLEKVKEHWEKGEVGPDSLCWRVGFGDWIPLSEATELASVLAPRPTRPVIVEPAPVASSTPVASGPVESAFSAGGASKRAETPAPVGPSAQDSGWKPSAASVLASLVKEENEALSKPAPKVAPVEEKVKPMASGLLDVPPPEPVAAPSPMMAEPHAPAPYMPPAPTYAPPPAQGYGPPMPQPQYAPPQAYAPPPAYPGYPPAPPPAQPAGNKMGMVIGVAVAAVLLVGTGVFFAMRPSATPPAPVAQAPVTPQPKPAEPPPAAPPTTPPTVAQTPPPAGSTVQPAAAGTTGQVVAASGTTATPPPATPPATAPGTPTAAATPPSAAKPPEPAKPEPTQVARVEPSERTVTKHPAGHAAPRATPAEDKEPVAAARPAKSSGAGADDEFDELFGTNKKTGATKPAASSKNDIYIPPEPGGGGGATVERLGQSDIMQVVINNKPAIVKCVSEQKKKDPGVSGKLVMRWTIQTSGKTKGVSCQTSEFRSSYMASCIGTLIKGWTFPKHRVQGEPIDFPFTF